MATMKDVARLAGVSTSTVSHVINNNRFVSDSVRQRVLEAVQQLNYAPSALARSLKMNQTHTLGMLVTTSNNPFFAEVVRGVERSCYERGYSLILCNTEGDPARMSQSMETLLQKRVDGLLMMCTENFRPAQEMIARYPALPTVMMDWALFDGQNDIIQDNSFLGGQIATRYLIERGYTRIACLAGPKDKSPSCQRLEGFLYEMKQAALPVPPEYILFGDFEFAGGVQAMKQLLTLPTPPHALFTGNDAMAVGVYQVLFEAGLRVGDDVAVVGYDDIELARYMSPPLTTIHQPKDELGELAVDTLVHRLKHPTREPQTLVLTPQLIERGSVSVHHG
ncbi:MULTISPECIES: ribose operon transcriptional repressor RbsR [Edwardsiella]|uniref:Ribose operon repressor n=2 Tax=Edwardsiella anguillarum TaxID=1821960 RepID=A0A076LRF2_9GAMM|nr:MULTISPECIES: ribose operon transcriptional repressor RbsR [Edwardsiella]AIJ08184.1 ribose operon repressor [Edwardsiella anguillarum ET080813]AKR79234.1 ribose operon transcriptional repressor RbsR [Edwardsiella sp. LADL05-105]KAB0591739.1 ribose operon transcriptional repressor RbsR [Edwardsiella anguillarum]RFT04233.1 transcriptional regulator RbsR [Edwardsiella anguillarum]UOU79073.1 ribose operon transcriptional repressor RbsR [Edwardsiella anguillarum]